MWIASKIGFYSIVKKGTPETWQIRARIVDDLKNLITAAKLNTEIISTPAGDYCCRIIVNHAQLETIMRIFAESIDYQNFKSEVARIPGQRGKLGAYHDFWGGMSNLQQNIPS